MPADHFNLVVPTSKIDPVVSFLVASLQHLGFKELMRPFPTAVGLGETEPYFWITGLDDAEADVKTLATVGQRQHIAFSAKSVEEVKQFHAAGLKAGGTCNGPPGLRPHFGPGYYGAFVLDPAHGVNFEVVYRGASADAK